MAALTIGVVSLVAAACGERPDLAASKERAVAGPSVSVSPATLDFVYVVGEKTLSLTIKNVGDAPIEIVDIELK